MDGGSGCRKQGPPNSFDRPPGLGAWCVSGGDCVVVSGRVLAAGDLAAVTSRIVADCYQEGDADSESDALPTILERMRWAGLFEVFEWFLPHRLAGTGMVGVFVDVSV